MSVRTKGECQQTGKRRYESAIFAGYALEETHGLGHNTTAYVCPHCRGWHLTSRVSETEKTR